MRKVVLTLLIVLNLGSSIAISQEMLGLAFGNYAGINSAFLNPALISGSKAYLDINIAGAQTYFKNNWAYVPKEDKNIWELIQSDTLIPKYGKWKYNGLYTYYKNTNTKHAFQSSRVIGPSVLYQNGDMAFGLSISARVATSGTNIPFEIPIFIYEGLTYEEMQDIIYDDYDFNFSNLAWTEMAAHWAYNFKRPYKSILTVGASVKLNLAYAGGYSINPNAKYVVYDSRNVQFFNYDAEYGYALPFNYDSTNFVSSGPFIKGYGGGIDIGFVYTRLKNGIRPPKGKKACSYEYEDYIYKLGVSILDLGAVYLNKNAQQHKFDNVSVFWSQFDTVEFHNINSAMKTLSKAFYNDENKSYQGNSFTIGLPTALSVQFDSHLSKNIYLGAAIFQPIRFNKKQVRRPAQIAIIPRFEHDIIELSIPVSVVEYQYVRVGAAFRAGPITIGSERLGTLLGLSDLDGADIYVSLKIHFNKGRCSDKRKGACSNSNFGYKKPFKRN